MSGWRALARILAIVLIAVFVPLTGGLLLAYSAQQAASQGDFLADAFEDPRLFEVAISEAAVSMAFSVPHDPETRDLPIASMDDQDWEAVLRTLLPPDDMQSWAQDATESLRNWVRSGGSWADDIILPFGSIRSNLFEDPNQVVLRTITEAQTPCGPGQSPLAAPASLVPSCRPPDAELEAFYDEVGNLWQAESGEVWEALLPGEMRRYSEDIPLGEFVRQEGHLTGGELRTGWRWARWGMALAGGVLQVLVVAQAVILLGIVAVLAARSWGEALRWAGAPLALAGLFTVGLGLLALVGTAFGPLVIVPLEHTWIDLDSLTGGVARALGNEIWGSMSFHGSILTLVGLLLWVSSLFLPARSVPAVSPASVDSPDSQETPQASGSDRES
jgi:hypothetical protein